MITCELYNVKRGRVCGLKAVTYLKLGHDATREYAACNAHTLNAANANARHRKSVSYKSLMLSPDMPYEWRRVDA